MSIVLLFTVILLRNKAINKLFLNVILSSQPILGILGFCLGKDLWEDREEQRKLVDFKSKQNYSKRETKDNDINPYW